MNLQYSDSQLQILPPSIFLQNLSFPTADFVFSKKMSNGLRFVGVGELSLMLSRCYDATIPYRSVFTLSASILYKQLTRWLLFL